MNPEYYAPVFLHVVVLFSLYEALKPASDSLLLPSRSRERGKVLFWTVALSLWLGLRPVDSAFVDTVTYARVYQILGISSTMDYESDVLFYGMLYWFAQAGFDVGLCFLFIELVYIGGISYAAFKFFPNRAGAVLAFMLTAFSFFNYAVNGLRNGMACSLFLFALPFVKEKRWIWAALFCLMAVNVHISMLIPVAALALSYFYTNTKAYMLGWLLCIGVMLVKGDLFDELLMTQDVVDTGKDAAYFSNDSRDMTRFSHTGVRYDFLLYGCVPILVGYYYVVRKHFQDAWYKVMLNTYVICNSFWVLVNRNWLSNRIAYLSWFMYGLVVMYPLLMNPTVRGRGLKIACALSGNAMFTYLMWLAGKFH